MVNVKCGDRVYDVDAVLFDKDGTLSNSHEYLRLVGLKRAMLIDQVVADRASGNFADRLLSVWGLREAAVHPASLLAVGSRQDNTIVTAGLVAELGYSWMEALKLVEEVFAIATSQMPIKHEVTVPYAGVESRLQRLQAAGLKLGILSADVLPNIERFATHYDLGQYFDFYQGAEAGLSKPNPRLFELACDGLGVAAARTLMIGDSGADVELGIRAGAAGSIGVSWGWPTPFDIPNADIMLRSIDEIQLGG
jgi:phosphoglycolate phosphatase